MATAQKAKKRRDKQLLLFSPSATMSFLKSPSRWPVRGTFADALTRANAMPIPPEARALSAPLQRLARLCAVLQQDAGTGVFALGSTRAAEVLGAPKDNWQAGAQALRELEATGLIVLVRLGSKGLSCSRWRWVPPLPRPVVRLRLWCEPG